MAKNNYISLQGRFYLSEIINGAPSAMRWIGNVPDFELEIGADILEHQESHTGQRTTDFVMVQKTNVNFSGQIEEVNKENIELILSGTNNTIESKVITDESLGTVVVGQEIKLGGYNLTQVTFTDSTTGAAVTIDSDKYTLDAKFGTVIFHDIAGVEMPIKASYTTGKVTSTTLASDFEREYQLFFKGINTANGEHVAVTLWRIKKSPEATFPLIHEELGQYQLQGQALSDVTKQADDALGLYGNMVVIPNVVP